MSEKNQICFAIMPISDPEGYEKGHFAKVYEDIFKPAIEKTGYIPHRVDEDTASSLIQTKIIRNLIEAPMAICDLSTRNPNVLFELGIRQAFNKPVVLVQEEGTERIFDIASISCIDYDPTMSYRGVLDTQRKIEQAIKSTKTYKNNSLINELHIEPAKLPQPITDENVHNQDLLYALLIKINAIDDNIQKLKTAYSENALIQLPIVSKDPLARKAYMAYLKGQDKTRLTINQEGDIRKTLGERMAEMDQSE